MNIGFIEKFSVVRYLMRENGAKAKAGFYDALVSASAAASTNDELLRFTREVVDAYKLPEGITMPWGRVVKP